MTELTEQQQHCQEAVTTLKGRHSKMEEAYKNTETELKELLQQSPSLSRAVMSSS